MPESELNPCPFCGSENLQVASAMGEWRVSCVECDASVAMKPTREKAVAAWNQRTDRNRYPAVMVVGDDHDRTPLIDAINQIGFDGIIIAEEDHQVSLGLETLNFELPERCEMRGFRDRETNAQRCGYSTKRK